jgi:predicted DNA-binding transcriptional regulator AlpA
VRAAPEAIMDQLVQAKEYLGYKELYAMGIINSRTDLARKQKTAGFPMPIKFSPARSARAIWPRHEVIAWIEAVRYLRSRSAREHRMTIWDDKDTMQ